MQELMKAKLGCTINGNYFGSIFYADDIVLVGASARKIQKMIDTWRSYCEKHGICLNPNKTKWLGTNVFNECTNVVFDINGIIIENVGHCIKYLGINLVMCKKVLTVDIDERIKKFNGAAYNVLLNTVDLSEPIRCELIVKKCLPVLIYGIDAIKTSQDDVYRLDIAYRQIFRYIFKLLKWAHLSKLL